MNAALSIPPSERLPSPSATQLVESVRGEMDYLAWFTAIVRAYPENPHDWRTAMQTAADVRLALHLAESLVRARPARAPRLSRQVLAAA